MKQLRHCSATTLTFLGLILLPMTMIWASSQTSQRWRLWRREEMRHEIGTYASAYKLYAVVCSPTMAYPSQAIVLIVVSSVFPALAVVAVGLRMVARHLSATRINWSDIFILFTLLNAILNAIACIIGAVACGIGLPIGDLSTYMKVRFLKILFVTQFFYIFSVWGVKVSILLFYKSIFKTRGFTRAVNATLVVLGAWIIAFFFVTLFQDKPIQRNWGMEDEGTTINWRDFYITEVASDVALDLFILCLPLPVIHRLNVSRRKKWMLAGMFWLGAIIIVASTVRLYYMVLMLQQFQTQDNDFSYTTIDSVIWGSIEPCMSVVAACLPMLSTIFFRKKKAQGQRQSRPKYLSSFFQRSDGSKRPPVKGEISRITDSIDQLTTRDYDTSGAVSPPPPCVRPNDRNWDIETQTGGPQNGIFVHHKFEYNVQQAV